MEALLEAPAGAERLGLALYTFCFVVAPSVDEASRACTRAVERVRSEVPSLGSMPQVETVTLAESSAAFAVLKPSLDVSPSHIQWRVTEEAAVVAFGAQGGEGDLAGAVLAEFAAGGVERVATMSGKLSAVIVERRARRAWIVGTLLGHRSLFYFSDRDWFVASPHDLTLLATGRVPFEIDYTSLASMVGCDWSLGGHSLLARVKRCHPLEAVRWEAGRTTLRAVDPLPLHERVAEGDEAGARGQLDRIEEAFLDSVRAHVGGAARVRCSLTAGMDSRAVLAAIVGAKLGLPVVASTTGGERSLDVVMARRLCALVGAAHERHEPEEPDPSDFEGSLRLRAFFCSGDTNGKRAMTRLPEVDPRAEPLAGGNGGEIYRGFFYPYFGLTGRAPRDLVSLAERLVRWRFRRLHRLPFAEPESLERVRGRLLATLSGLERRSSNPYDVVDLFYVFERYGRWGALQAAQPWVRSWTPFESAAAVRAAFKLPAPIGERCDVHTTLIRRHLPKRAFWMPINGAQLLILNGPGRLRHTARQTLAAGSLVAERLRRRVQKRARRADDVKAAFLSAGLASATEALLDEEASLSRALFGRQGVRALIGAHGKRGDQLAALGILLTAEMWRRLARELSRP